MLAARACDTPIYRYALENWKPAHYKLVIFNTQTHDTSALCDTIEAAHANISVASVNLSADVPAEYQALREASKNKPTPWMVLSYPDAVGAPRPLWSAPCTRENVAALLDSPLRTNLVQRLASGDAAVWILVGGGHSGDGIAKSMEAAIEKLSTEFLSQAVESGSDARAHFSLLRVASDDPKEAVLLRMLTERSKSAAIPANDTARAYLVFGRGRAIGPLSGDEIDPSAIARATAFLAGPCLCEIKEQNPGMDLLLDANWRELLPRHRQKLTSDTASEISPAPTPTATVATPAPPVEASRPLTTAAAVEIDSHVNTGVFCAATLIGAGIVSLLYAFRGRRS